MLKEILKRMSISIKGKSQNTFRDTECLMLSPEKTEFETKDSFRFSFQCGKLLFTLFKDANCKLFDGTFCKDRISDFVKKNRDEDAIESIKIAQSIGHV